MSAYQQVDPSPEVPPQVTMLQIISGFWLSRAVYIAAKLGLADLVTRQPKSAEELAQATETHAPSLYRVLRALASAGIFAEDQDQRFHSTSLAATLQSDLPGSLRFFAMTELGEEHYPAWEHAQGVEDHLHGPCTHELVAHCFAPASAGVGVMSLSGSSPKNEHTFPTRT